MKTSKSTNFKSFKGEGYIIGAILGIIAAIVAFIFTKNIVISIPLLAGLSIPLGICIEHRLQDEAKDEKPYSMKITLSLIGLGIISFLSFVFVTKFI